MRRLGAFVLAAATLTLETALIRIFALAQGYHFAFMTIGIALLGLGAGGTLLASWSRINRRLFGHLGGHGLRQPRRRASRKRSSSGHDGGPDVVVVFASIGFAITALGGYLFGNSLPLDVYRIAWERMQSLYLLAYYLALALPFFFSGLAMALLLETTEAGNVVYAANLLGSASGILMALGALSYLGGPGTVALSAAEGCIAAGLLAWHGSRGRRGRRAMVVLTCALCSLIPLAIARFFPHWLEVRLSPYRSLSYAVQFPEARVLSSQWNAFSRVDVVDSTAIHVSPGLSLGYTGGVPVQRGLFVDAHAQAAIVASSVGDEGTLIRAWADHLPLALVFRLYPQADMLVLEPGGGLDVAIARSQGAAHITAVTSNPLVVDAARQFGSGLYSDTDVEGVVQSPRSFVRRMRSGERTRFDVVDLALNDAQRTVVSGAYTLSEDYRYTVQAFVDYLDLLRPDGVLVIHRWLQTPPSESLRAWALAIEALAQSGRSPPYGSLIAIRSWSTMLILVKNGSFTVPELDMVRQFCAARQFDLVYLPGLQPEEANRHNLYQDAPYFHTFRDLLFTRHRESVYREQRYDIRPPTDDKPYFFHFFRWRQVPEIWQALGHTWQPFGGGGYLVLIALFGIATLTSLTLILLPSAFIERHSDETSALPRGLVLTYFGCLGVAYLAIEIPLIQRFVLFVDHPTIAFATVVSVLLISSGVGSLLAPRLRAQWVIPLLVIYVLVLLVSLPHVFGVFLGRSLAGRIMVASVLLTPLGVLMGVPFPTGLALVHRRAPGMISWAWGVNGCTSVIVSILAALIALNWGFNVVLAVAAVVYLIAWGVLLRIDRVLSHWREGTDRDTIRVASDSPMS